MGWPQTLFLPILLGLAEGDELAEDLYLPDTPYSADKGFEGVGKN